MNRVCEITPDKECLYYLYLEIDALPDIGELAMKWRQCLI